VVPRALSRTGDDLVGEAVEESSDVASIYFPGPSKVADRTVALLPDVEPGHLTGAVERRTGIDHEQSSALILLSDVS